MYLMRKHKHICKNWATELIGEKEKKEGESKKGGGRDKQSQGQNLHGLFLMAPV